MSLVHLYQFKYNRCICYYSSAHMFCCGSLFIVLKIYFTNVWVSGFPSSKFCVVYYLLQWISKIITTLKNIFKTLKLIFIFSILYNDGVNISLPQAKPLEPHVQDSILLEF